MKPGSLVIALKTIPPEFFNDGVIKDNIYTVLEVKIVQGIVAILLEETRIIKGCYWNANIFREVEFPDDLEREIKDCLTRPVPKPLKIEEFVVA